MKRSSLRKSNKDTNWYQITLAVGKLSGQMRLLPAVPPPTVNSECLNRFLSAGMNSIQTPRTPTHPTPFQCLPSNSSSPTALTAHPALALALSLHAHFSTSKRVLPSVSMAPKSTHTNESATRSRRRKTCRKQRNSKNKIK
jgi:hypothetical protein